MGATPLRPEQAVNRSAGLVLDAPRLPLITLDVYQITIADRIGLRGTAKVYGPKVALGYYVLRKPIAFLRRSLGI